MFDRLTLDDDAAQRPADPAPISPDVLLRSFMDARSLVDAALYRPASQSTLSPWSTLDGAGAAVSGLFPPDFAFHTSLEKNPWWQVDLGWEFPVEFIIVHNRRLDGQERADGIEVSVSVDGLRWTLVHKGCVRFQAGPDGLPLIIPPAVPARYVRIQLPGLGYLHLSQVEVLVKAREMRLRDIAERIEAGRAVPVSGEPVQIGVMGTSNSLMGSGYTAALRDHPGFVLQPNLSLGSSHATFVAYRWDDALIEPCRVMLFDLNVNQQLAAGHGVWPEPLARQVFLDILARCAHLAVIPVFVILPEGWSYQNGGETAFVCRETYIRLCKEYRIPYFDGYCVLERLSAATTIPVSTFLKGPAHVEHRLRRHFGSLLAAALLRAVPRLTATRHSVAVNALSYVPATQATDVASLPFITRSNSLLSADLLALRPGMRVQVPLPPGTSVVGLVFNLVRANAGLRIAGEITTVKNLNTPLADPGAFWVVSWCLLHPVQATEAGVSLECVLSGDLHGMEENDHGNTPHDVTAGEAVIELAGLVVSHAAAQRSIPAFPSSAIDLWQFAAEPIVTALPPWPTRLPPRASTPTVA